MALQNRQLREMKEEIVTQKLLAAKRECARDIEKAVENFKNRIGHKVTGVVINYSPNSLPLVTLQFGSTPYL